MEPTFSLDHVDFNEIIEFSVVYETRSLQEVISLVLLNLTDPKTSKSLQTSQNPVTKNFLLYPFLELMNKLSNLQPYCSQNKTKTKYLTLYLFSKCSPLPSYNSSHPINLPFCFQNVCSGLWTLLWQWMPHALPRHLLLGVRKLSLANLPTFFHSLTTSHLSKTDIRLYYSFD